MHRLGSWLAGEGGREQAEGGYNPLMKNKDIEREGGRERRKRGERVREEERKREGGGATWEGVGEGMKGGMVEGGFLPKEEEEEESGRERQGDEGEGVRVCVVTVQTRDKETQTSAHRRARFHDGKHGGCGGHADHADQAEEAVHR